MAKRKSNIKPENKPNSQSKEIPHSVSLHFTPRSVARGLETLEAYSMRKVNEEALRRAAEQQKRQLTQQDYEQCKKYFSDQYIRSYWLKQFDKAASLPVQYWGKSRIEWPKDKAVVYTIMAICIQKYSHFKIIPDSFKKTSQYEANKHIDGAFQYFNNFSSTEFLSYIETDLKANGLLQEDNPSEKPPDLITLTVAIEEFHVARSTLKRAIKDGSIHSYRTSEKGMHRVKRADIAKKYLKRD